MSDQSITLKNVHMHNLKGVDVVLPPRQLVVLTGVSGSGKSSLAFDTLFVEGQRRYVESLSAHVRRQMQDMAKPELESASGITPTIAIEQKTAGKNPRSTVGTLTEIYDYLRVLFARLSTPHCPVSGEVVSPQSKEQIIQNVQTLPEGTKIQILSPFAKDKKGEFKEEFQELVRKGFLRARVDGALVELSEEISLDGRVGHTVEVIIDRVVIRKEEHPRIADSLATALEMGQGSCIVLQGTEEELFFSLHGYSLKSGLSYSSLRPQDFSFNSPSGMCDACKGLGTLHTFDLEKILDPNKSIAEDCISIASSYKTVRFGNIYDNLATLYDFNVDTPWKKLSKEAQEVLLHGTKKKWTRMTFFNKATGARWVDQVRWRGILHELHTRYAEAKSDSYRKKREQLMSEQLCPECQGGRLKPYPAAARFFDHTLSEISQMPLEESLVFFQNIELDKRQRLIGAQLLREISERLRFLIDVGLGYLTLDRTAPTLSGGEAQRVRLASQIGCGLVGITYILDEPSIGLHPRDNKKLIQTLQTLRDRGNRVLVVEHDEETMRAADQIIDFGPGAGEKGGEIIAQGSVEELMNAPDSLTGQYLSGALEITIPKKRRKPTRKKLTLSKINHHNLHDLTVSFPLGLFLAITGVSGSGKSSLISDTLYPALARLLQNSEQKGGAYKTLRGTKEIDKVIAIDQAPIGRNPRSNPATYVNVFSAIRDLFCKLPESRARGYQPGRFSFNVKEGSCSHCLGMGMVKIDMDFLEDEWITCSLCQGKRFDHETLTIYYKGKTIYDVLEMNITEACAFFSAIPAIASRLQTLQEVGMGYIKLGQSSTTLSGGEAQRVKLAKELTRPPSGHTLYILDEPTTGLHPHDIQQLLSVLQKLVERGNSVFVIEHNMDVVKCTDWIIDLGPEGGSGGGQLVAAAPPEKIAQQNTPTGNALKEILHPERKLLPPSVPIKEISSLSVQGAQQHNLKDLSIEIPRKKLTICCGPSGSGKSSLAFDTIYAEGQRRYIESLSPYARQFVKQMPKPKVENVEGLSPAVAIEQKAHAGNPRSTIGTMTEIYDYLRLLYARVGIPHCPETKEEIRAISKEHIAGKVLGWPEGEKIQILAPIPLKRGEAPSNLLSRLQRQGFIRIRLDREFYDLDEPEKIPLDKKKKQELFLVVDRIILRGSIQTRLLEAIENAAEIGDNTLLLMKGDEDLFFNLSFSVESTGKSYPAITPQTFAFNTLEGMCPDCQGLGVQYGANLSKFGTLLHKTSAQLLRSFCLDNETAEGKALFETLLKKEGIDPHTPLAKLPKKALQRLLNGSETAHTIANCAFRWIGINNVLAKAGKSARKNLREVILPLLDEGNCSSCEGSRINALARHVTIENTSIDRFCALSIQNARTFLNTLSIDKQEGRLLEEVHTQLLSRLQFLEEVGLGYLALDRRAPTLSGGEAQRIRLASQLGSSLSGVLYVLDEPTIGLHPRDTSRLHQTLNRLKDLGNTLLMVEHDPQTLALADHLLDFGPQSGSAGGYLTAQGTFSEIKENPNSLTGAYLSGKKQIPSPKKRRPLSGKKIQIKNARKHNLQNISLALPYHTMIGITGVSGSGKSTLINKLLLPAVKQALPRKSSATIEETRISNLDLIDRVIAVDQNPIGQTIRSTVATYTDVFTPLRSFFSSLPDARKHGLEPKNFSYNHRRGMCTTCWGLGIKRIELHFLPPVRVTCDACQGLKLNPVSLSVTYKGKNLGQYLSSTIEEAKETFAHNPYIVRILDTLIDVGLGYLTLGQTVASLSGGEAQRIKLSKELSKTSRGHTLYLLDEPTTGLHPDDIGKLLPLLHSLVDKGNTMIIIEHNLDIIKNCDYLVDLGPEAGEKGGELLFAGSPEKLLKHPTSHTAKHLREYLIPCL